MDSSIKLLGVLLSLSILISCGDDASGPGETPPDPELGNLFVSSNTTSVIGVYNFSDLDDITSISFGSSSDDADGIAYMPSTDVLYQASRSDNRLDVYTNISETQTGGSLTLSSSGSSDFSNARKLAVNGDQVLVAQDAAESNNQQDRFYVYDVSSGSVSLQNVYDPQMNLWDVQFEGNTLYAVQDNSDTLAVFNNILNNADGLVTADQKVQIEGIVRTHAHYYSSDADIMFMTDVADANSDSDGAIHVITNFSSKLSAAGNGGTISLGDQIRIAGGSTQLGNPVGIAYDSDNEIIFVAERAVDGGRVLAFDLPENGGDIAPFFSETYNGASAVYYAR